MLASYVILPEKSKGNIMAINTKVLSGFMELLPQEQIEFDRIKSLVESSFHKFGYTSLDTPVIERSEVLLAKGSAETDKQTYFVSNGMTGHKLGELALRFDLTVPLARYVADHFNDLYFPFKRAHIGKSYRGERAQKGRFREFYQCDIDVIGKDWLSLYYDAEMPYCVYKLFKEMDIGKFTIRINNRRVMNGFFEDLGLFEASGKIMRIVDKAEKITEQELVSAFEELGLSKPQIDSIMRFTSIKGDVDSVLDSLDSLKLKNEQFLLGLSELKSVTEIMAQMGTHKDFFVIDLSIARGLDYYTGTVYETTLDDNPIGSICGGGRYDDLAGHYISKKLPGVGVSIGLSRLFWQLREIGLLKFQKNTIADCIIVPETPSCMGKAFEASNSLQEIGINTEIFYDDLPMKKRFQVLAKKDAPYTVVARENDFSFQYKMDDKFVKEIVALDELVRRMKCKP